MNRKVVRALSIFSIICVCLFALTSCGKAGSSTSYQAAKNSTSDKYDDAVDWAEIEIATAIVDIKIEQINVEIENLDRQISELSEENSETKQELENRKAELLNEKNEYTSIKEQVWNIVLDSNKENDYQEVVNKINSLTEDENIQNKLKEKVINIILEYVNFEYVSSVTFKDKDDDKDIKNKVKKIYNNYKINLILADIERYTGYSFNEEASINARQIKFKKVDPDNSVIGKASKFSMLSTGVASQDNENREKFEEAFVTKSGCLNSSSLTNQSALKISNNNKETPYENIYEALLVFMIDVEMRMVEQEPIHFQLTSFSDFFKNFFDNFFVFPVGWLLYFLSSIFGGWYIIGLFFTTILIRTAGWPIYAKTNDMSLKMQVIQPEMQKLEEKYANRQDPDSQRMKQAELAQIYRKNKIGIGGCFLPFLQFPIFMAVYGAVRRFPYTVATENSIFSLNWANQTIFGKEMKPTLFGLPFNLFEDRTAGTGQLIGIIVLILLVCGTQYLSQKLSEIRQKQNHQKAQEDIPAYRRQAYKQTNGQGQNTMKYVMYMMIFMMGTFVFTSKAGLGIYWLIGNLYSMLQTFLNNLISQKKLAKMKEKAKKNR